MPASTSMMPPSWEEMDTASPEVKAVDDARVREVKAVDDARVREVGIEQLRHMVWCNAAKLNDAHRANIGAGLLALGVRR